MWRYKTDRLGNPNPAVQRRIDKVGMVDLNYHESREHLGYCFLEWDEVWEEEKQKVVDIQIDVRDIPKPIFKMFHFSFCNKHGENIGIRKEKRNMTRIFNPTKPQVEFKF